MHACAGSPGNLPSDVRTGSKDAAAERGILETRVDARGEMAIGPMRLSVPALLQGLLRKDAPLPEKASIVP